MRYFLTTLFIALLQGLSAQEEVNFIASYDSGGNMIERKIQVLPQFKLGKLDLSKDSSATVKEIEFNIYPNPANSELFIEGPLPNNIEVAKVNLLSVTGNLLLTDTYFGIKKMIYVGSLKNGIYLLQLIYSEKESKSYKIIISK